MRLLRVSRANGIVNDLSIRGACSVPLLCNRPPSEHHAFTLQVYERVHTERQRRIDRDRRIEIDG